MDPHSHSSIRIHLLKTSVADPHHGDTDPDPSCHFDAHLDPDPAPHQSDANQRPLVYRPTRLHSELPRFYCERPRPSTAPFGPLKLLSFDFHADQDIALHYDADPASQNYADTYTDPDLQQCSTQHFIYYKVLIFLSYLNMICWRASGVVLLQVL